MNLRKFLPLALVALSVPAFGDVSGGFRISTLGAGVDLTTSVVPDQINFRINANYFEYTHTAGLSSVSYHADLKLETVGFLGDWYPLDNAFYVAVGGYENTSKIDVKGRSAGGNYTFNGNTYTTAQVGTLVGKVKLGREFAPYVGVGWGNPVGASASWTFYTEVGGLFTGSPKLSLNSTGGSLSNDPNFRNNVEQERKSDQAAVSWSTVYPVVALGLAYKF